jgi:type IV pilus assembly protein PilW
MNDKVIRREMEMMGRRRFGFCGFKPSIPVFHYSNIPIFWHSKGVTLIELLIALVISGILIAALYRIFISQQKTYTVQEQVVDMQQNVRVAITKMMKEIRMTGFGNITELLNLPGGVNGFTQAISPESNRITIVGGFKQIRRDNGDPIEIASANGNQITLNYATDDFDGLAHRFISIGGMESNSVQSRAGAKIILENPLKLNHPVGTPIFKIQAVTYDIGVSGGKAVLRRNENTGGGRQPMAENIETVQFVYFDGDGNPTMNPIAIRMIRVTVTAKTNMTDPEFKGGDGYRRRTVASNVQLRNMGLNP